MLSIFLMKLKFLSCFCCDPGACFQCWRWTCQVWIQTQCTRSCWILWRQTITGGSTWTANGSRVANPSHKPRAASTSIRTRQTSELIGWKRQSRSAKWNSPINWTEGVRYVQFKNNNCVLFVILRLRMCFNNLWTIIAYLKIFKIFLWSFVKNFFYTDYAEFATQVRAAYSYSSRRRIAENDHNTLLPRDAVHSCYCLPEWRGNNFTLLFKKITMK